MNKHDKQEYQATVERDKAQCVICGNTQFHIHHIIGRRNGKTDRRNMICLCKKHHDMAHSNEKEWRPKLIELNERHYGTIKLEDLKKKGKYDGFRY